MLTREQTFRAHAIAVHFAYAYTPIINMENCYSVSFDDVHNPSETEIEKRIANPPRKPHLRLIERLSVERLHSKVIENSPGPKSQPASEEESEEFVQEVCDRMDSLTERGLAFSRESHRLLTRLEGVGSMTVSSAAKGLLRLHGERIDRSMFYDARVIDATVRPLKSLGIDVPPEAIAAALHFKFEVVADRFRKVFSEFLSGGDTPLPDVGDDYNRAGPNNRRNA